MAMARLEWMDRTRGARGPADIRGWYFECPHSPHPSLWRSRLRDRVVSVFDRNAHLRPVLNKCLSRRLLAVGHQRCRHAVRLRTCVACTNGRKSGGAVEHDILSELYQSRIDIQWIRSREQLVPDASQRRRCRSQRESVYRRRRKSGLSERGNPDLRCYDHWPEAAVFECLQGVDERIARSQEPAALRSCRQVSAKGYQRPERRDHGFHYQQFLHCGV